MKHLSKYIMTMLLLLPLVGGEAFCFDNGLWQSFMHPSNEARTKLWWFHGETTTTKEGIDADLKAFKGAGIGGVVFYDQTHGTGGRTILPVGSALTLRPYESKFIIAR